MLAITRKYADDPSKMGELRHPTNIKPLQEAAEKKMTMLWWMGWLRILRGTLRQFLRPPSD